MAAFADADARGLDLETGLPQLVGGRGFHDAGDVGSVLHHRVDRWLSAAGRRQDGGLDRIVGLFPQAVGVNDLDTKRALDERRALIEQRAHELAEVALERGQPWVAQLGARPDDPASSERWLRNVEVIAAYRDRWNVHDRTILGAGSTSIEQSEQREIAERAVTRALAIGHEQEAGDLAPNRQLTHAIERTVER